MVALIGAKLLALLIGLGFLAAGVWIIRAGGPIIEALNRDYAKSKLPLKFQYPSWWHRFFGWLVVGFGLLFGLSGAIFANGFPK